MLISQGGWRGNALIRGIEGTHWHGIYLNRHQAHYQKLQLELHGSQEEDDSRLEKADFLFAESSV